MFAIAMMFISFAASAYSAHEQYNLAQEAEDIAEENAAIEAKRTEETVRRAEKNEALQMSKARSELAASGMELAGTPEYYLSELERTGEEEIAWLEREGAWRVDSILREGEYARKQGEAGAWSTLFGGFTSMGSSAMSYDYYYGD